MNIAAFMADTGIHTEDIPNLLSELAFSAYRKYRQTGRRDDISEAVFLAKLGMRLTNDTNQSFTPRLNDLGVFLIEQYERTGEIGDLEEAIQISRQAVESTPNDHPDRAGWLNNLGSKLESRYKQTGEMGDLEEAIQISRQAVELTPDNHPDRAGRLNNLGHGLESRYERTREMGDLEEAIQISRQAVESTPDDHPDRAGWLNNLGNKLESRYAWTREIGDLKEASTYLLEAWACLNAVPFYRVRAAARCLKLLARQHRVDEAIDLGKEILILLPSVHTRALDRNDQQFVISTFAGVASDLCAFLLSANRFSEALECLEQGRAVIISQLLDDRTDVFSLRRDHSQLADQYQSLVDEMNPPVRQSAPDVVETLIPKRRREAAAELDTCLKEIRCLPGYERFMLGETVAEMQETVAEGCIVVINITDFRSDAILISRNSLKIIALPELSASDAWSWYLSWLWHACVKHILSEISATQKHPSEGRLRVWWIGSGLASSMPFHAAGVHTRESKENTYSRIISSYTPSIKALAYTQNQAKHVEDAPVAQGTILIAAMPTSPKGPSDKKALRNLPGVKEETEEILNLARSQMHTTVLTHPSADQVLGILKTCRIAHFACHGTLDYLDPSNSGLILQRSAGSDQAFEQDRLTVQRVSELRLRHAQIAYLSACSTAESKAAELSDEVIHVVSGFQIAGFPHVVGCLWPAGDSECVEVAKRFYSLVLRGSQLAINNNEVASALQGAVMAVRAGDLDMPLNWAQFVHYGA
ncbi:hypothetical protein QQS21_004879 [Conoideocrella luteorostrata]|uniref:CHAT domain-containing protein n=1 Tax=Conoideocrella luteorostrata TaxID=1105319 RepID=A0AAJ0FZH7_9HYPO|nr:hypothetical protein QQS21_004879 [Conoideocrella luteorostrata]